MTEIIDRETRKGLEKLLKDLGGAVKLVLFTQKISCAACRDQRQLLEELTGLSDRLTLEVLDLEANAKQARTYGISRVPATVVLAEERDPGIRFFGLTGGYEFGSLIESIRMVSLSSSGLSPELEDLISLIDEPLHLEIMVTLTCPYCPKMVHLAHQMALINPNIRADMVESSAFPQLVQRYAVGTVPRTVINGVPAFEGALPPQDAVLEIVKALNPRLFEQIDARLRETRGERRVSRVLPGHVYDILIVGAGPAALSAAIYAVRKNLDVALVGQSLGGQITNTASIENWLGIASISGQELAAHFRNHAERYPVALRLETGISRVVRSDDGFRAMTESGEELLSRSLIYCAGKEYRRLGVPGESRFLGKGIAFCATCDAPLFRDKRVAVIGGGNSAFTAARDLLGYAREIHIINILKDFQADAVLIAALEASPLVTFHPGMEVLEFLGQDSLSGVRIAAVSGGERLDLAADGVFLEIGLTPNSQPVSDLLELNEQGEIPVGRDQSTAVEGLFAAGDVTDEAEKQIVIAAGAGARAALAASRFLARQGLAGTRP